MSSVSEYCVVEEREVPRQEQPDPVACALRGPLVLPVIEHALELRVAGAFAEELRRRHVDEHESVETRVPGEVAEEPLPAHAGQRELHRAAARHVLPDVEVGIEQDPRSADDHDAVVVTGCDLPAFDRPRGLAVVEIARDQAALAHPPFPPAGCHEHECEHEPADRREPRGGYLALGHDILFVHVSHAACPAEESAAAGRRHMHA